jgi:cell division protein FtsI (penicillin-binding protein 3)
VQIAGKTGTARYAKDRETGKYKHRVSFCGFFPYDKPQYSCIVFIQNPRNGEASGGGMAGVVFKEIAEKVMAHKDKISIKTMPKDTMRTMMPRVKNGNYDATTLVLDRLKIEISDVRTKTVDQGQTPWIHTQSDSASVVLFPLKITESLVPNVIGMGAKDAVYLLENAGLRLQITGRGKVVQQSIQHGTRVSKGSTIILKLQI